MPGLRAAPRIPARNDRYGILAGPPDAAQAAPDPYQLDRRYWESLWYRPQGE